jgi:malate dehydrogenase (quinone)
MTDVETVLGFFEDDYEFDEAAFRDATIENFPRADEAAGGEAVDTEADDPVPAEADD